MAATSCGPVEDEQSHHQITPLPVVEADTSVGGYDCDFVDPPPDDLLCKICHFPARDPLYSVCCGQSFCKYCLGRYLQSETIDHDQCPYCRAVKEKFQTVPDKRAKRQIFYLNTFCPNKPLGCPWKGELRLLEKHLNINTSSTDGCPFTVVDCSFDCGLTMCRYELQDHLNEDCELRQVSCEYCSLTGSYQLISGSHQQEECPKYLVECPNHCEIGNVLREDVADHLKECPLALVECAFARVGCNSVVRRQETLGHMKERAEQHMECNRDTILSTRKELEDKLSIKEEELQEVKKHLKRANETIDHIKERLDGKEKEMAEMNKKMAGMDHQFRQLEEQVAMINNITWSLQLSNQASAIESGSEDLPVVIKLSGFQEMKQKRITWHSPGFYSGCRGDLVSLHVEPNARVEPTGDLPPLAPFLLHQSYEFIKLSVHLSTESLDMLYTDKEHSSEEWLLTVQVLNQTADRGHAEPLKFRFDSTTTKFERVTEGGRCTRYDDVALSEGYRLKDDCIFFRVCSFV